MISVREWVELCYKIAGKQAEFFEVYDEIEQRNYFSFYDYEYCLDVTDQYDLMSETMSLCEGLKRAFDWYVDNQDKVNKKPMMEYIDMQF